MDVVTLGGNWLVVPEGGVTVLLHPNSNSIPVPENHLGVGILSPGGHLVKEKRTGVIHLGPKAMFRHEPPVILRRGIPRQCLVTEHRKGRLEAPSLVK